MEIAEWGARADAKRPRADVLDHAVEPEFRNQYARAREDQADTYAELGLEAAIHADDPAKGRLAFDALVE